MYDNDITRPFNNEKALAEKRMVAASSVAVAVILTGGKLGVGLISGSLGILSEALHSALDLVAAVITFFAIRASARPADSRHSYGHGKIENVSALFETLLLLGTCVWIIVEAVARIRGKAVHVDANYMTFVIMAVSIVLDISRSRALKRVSIKYNSQALEADALHFSTDVYSSVVVIVGLGLVWLSGRIGVPWLALADSVAALGVAGIVIWISIKLGRRAVGDLIDEAPHGIAERIEETCKANGVSEVVRTRVRMSGPQAFADLTVRVPGGTTLAQGHAIADRIERNILQYLPGADIVVHVEPEQKGHRGAGFSTSRIRLAADACGLDIHNIRIVDVGGDILVEFHAEVPASTTVSSAHDLVTCLEADLQKEFPIIKQVISHIEPASSTSKFEPDAVVTEQISGLLDGIVKSDAMLKGTGKILVNGRDAELNVSLTCFIDPGATVADAHSCTDRLEQVIRASNKRIGSVVIHVEPANDAGEKK
jgi:cation diffusion facilitator family transporter